MTLGGSRKTAWKKGSHTSISGVWAGNGREWILTPGYRLAPELGFLVLSAGTAGAEGK